MKNYHTKNILIVIIVVLIVALLTFVSYVFYGLYQGVNVDSSNLSQPIARPDQPAPNPTDDGQENRLVDPGVTWQKPIKLGELPLFKPLNEGQPNNYYQVGRTKAGDEIILAEVLLDEPSLGPDLFRFIKKTDGYYLISKNSASLDGFDKSALGDFKVDRTTAFSSLLPSQTITHGQTKLTASFSYGLDDFLQFSSPKKIGSTKWGDLYSTSGQVDNEPDVLLKTLYFIQLKDSTKAVYESRPEFMRDDGTLAVSWVNQKGQSASFTKVRFGGCGLGAGLVPMVNRVSDLATKQLMAKSTGGDALYTITDQNNALVQYLYNVYKSNREGVDLKSTDDFINDLGFILWTDDYGSTLVFSNNTYQPVAECGKPVIYLYPDRVMAVQVKVGAQITKSEPDYNQGWRVIARPDGTFQLGQREYHSLFWEGLGLGQYPTIKAGLVVERAKIERTIKDQLGLIGLNQHETQDFLDFWLPKMPTTPYTRLTWFQNSEMNRLAPLTISPHPDSIIRVFLDFEGLDQKVTLRPQALQTVERRGFTVVEWGGLLK